MSNKLASFKNLFFLFRAEAKVISTFKYTQIIPKRMDKKALAIGLLVLAFAIFVVVGGVIKKPASEELTTPPVSDDTKVYVEILPSNKTAEEVEEVSETYDYAQRDLEHDWGLFETKLLSTGFYTHEVDGTEVTEFRADIWVKNAGEETSEFMQDKAYVEKISVDKYSISGGTFDGKDVAVGEEREGSLLFSTVPQDISGDVVLVIGNSVAYSPVFGTITQQPHRYEIDIE